MNSESKQEKDLVSLEELTDANIWLMAITAILLQKGILTRGEIMEEIKQIACKGF